LSGINLDTTYHIEKNNVMKTKSGEKLEEKITRKEALQKAGKYAAFTAAAAIILLSPKGAQAVSNAPNQRGNGYNNP
jgi:hypothetical protein